MLENYNFWNFYLSHRKIVLFQNADTMIPKMLILYTNMCIVAPPTFIIKFTLCHWSNNIIIITKLVITSFKNAVLNLHTLDMSSNALLLV